MLRLEPLESGPGRLGLEMTARVTRALRGALLHHAAEPIPEFLSGHEADGSPSRETHLAWVPLADVGHRHADGHLLGVAAVLPQGLTREQRRLCLVAVGSMDELRLGRLGRWRLAPEVQETPPKALRPESWTTASSQWASVTPVVFDRFTDDLIEKREVIATSCERVGLPRPMSVILTRVSAHIGVPHAADFPLMATAEDAPRRPHIHVILSFGTDVEGPVILGAGRYRGYGLLRPHRGG